MNDPDRADCEGVLRRVLARNGEAGPEGALCALLWLLGDRHRAEVKAFAARAFREGFELPDHRAGTAAEDIRDLAAGMARVPTPGAEGDGRAADSGMDVVAGVLGELIPLWDFEGVHADPEPRPQPTHPPYAPSAPRTSR